MVYSTSYRETVKANRKIEYFRDVIDIRTMQLRPFSTRRNFPRGAEFLFVFSNIVPPEKSQDKEKFRARGKFRLVHGKRPLIKNDARDGTCMRKPWMKWSVSFMKSSVHCLKSAL